MFKDFIILNELSLLFYQLHSLYLGFFLYNVNNMLIKPKSV